MGRVGSQLVIAYQVNGGELHGTAGSDAMA